MDMTKRELRRAARVARRELTATESKFSQEYDGEEEIDRKNINMNMGVYTPVMGPKFKTVETKVPDEESRKHAENDLHEIYAALGNSPERIDVLIERDKVWVHYGVMPYLIHRVHEVISRGFGGLEEKTEEVEETECHGGAGWQYKGEDGTRHKGPK